MSIGKITSSPQPAVAYTPKKNIAKKEQSADLKSDTLTLTQEAKEFLERQKTGKADKNANEEEFSAASSQLEAFRKQMEESDDNNKSSVMDFAKCMKIARRIQNGDKVPLKDMKFLAEKYPELYKYSILLKKNNPEPKKYKSCLDKGDEKSDNSECCYSENESDTFITDALEDMGE